MNEYNEMVVEEALPIVNGTEVGIAPELDADGNVIVYTAPFDAEAEEVAVD